MVDGISHKARRDKDHSKGERAHIPHLLVLATDDRKAQQQHLRNSNRDRSKQAARNPERTRQVRLSKAQYSERHELQEQAESVKKNIERNQPGKTQTKAH